MTTKQKKVKLMKLTSDEPLDSRHVKLFKSLAETRKKIEKNDFKTGYIHVMMTGKEI